MMNQFRSLLELKRQSPQAFSFGVCQLLLLGALVASVTAGVSNTSTQSLRLPDYNTQPISVLPQSDDPRIVTDEQLVAVLDRLQPAFGRQQPKINYVDHALRFWGLETAFSDPNALSGSEMRSLLVDDSAFVAAWGEQTKPLLIPTEWGVNVRMQQGLATASHVDHTLASLAETGTPLDHPMQLRNGTATVESLLKHALSDFSLNQLEYEWTALALALYAPSAEKWVSKEGQDIDFNLLAKRLMRQRWSQGVCYGNHRLYTLTILLRVDDDHAILTAATRRDLLGHLTDVTRQLVAVQSIEGYWDETWARDGRLLEDESPEARLRSRILATGHALEWWAMAPEELHPPREVMVRAGQWLAREIEVMDQETVLKNYTFLSHAGRALALWRGGVPCDVLKRLKVQPETGA
jgi:hypothetical protein